MKVKIGIIQNSCSLDSSQNLDKAIANINKAIKKGANIICLQELFKYNYFCDVEDYCNFSLAESIPGPTTDILCDISIKSDVVLIASLFEERAPGIYHNTAAVIDAGGEYLGKYRKMHIPDDPNFYEKFYFSPGDLGYKVFKTKYGNIGVLICWDQWFPESARITSLMGAQILFYPTAIGCSTSEPKYIFQDQYNAWKTIQLSHSIANGVHVVSVNRVGLEQQGNMMFWGGSFIANPQGKILYEAPNNEEIVQVFEIDLKDSRYYRNHWPFLRDRRIDSYSYLTKLFID